MERSHVHLLFTNKVFFYCQMLIYNKKKGMLCFMDSGQVRCLVLTRGYSFRISHKSDLEFDQKFTNPQPPGQIKIEQSDQESFWLYGRLNNPKMTRISIMLKKKNGRFFFLGTIDLNSLSGLPGRRLRYLPIQGKQPCIARNIFDLLIYNLREV